MKLSDQALKPQEVVALADALNQNPFIKFKVLAIPAAVTALFYYLKIKILSNFLRKI